jgi:hypothetical protein
MKDYIFAHPWLSVLWVIPWTVGGAIGVIAAIAVPSVPKALPVPAPAPMPPSAQKAVAK